MMYTIPPGTGLRLHLNENTAGCSPRVLDALRGLTATDLATYPDYSAATKRVERYVGSAPGWVQLVNGLDEGLHVAAAAATQQMRSEVISSIPKNDLRPHFQSAVIPEPAFEMYAICAQAVGLAVVRVQPRPEFEFALDEIIEAGRGAAIVYLTDPNNPTGLGIPSGAVETIAKSLPGTLVFVDEAYTDFSGRTLVGPVLDRYRNVVVGRTFAKGHGLAALRIGALVAHPDALAPIRSLLPPFSVNVAATTALVAALDDEEWLRQYVADVVQSRERLYRWCDARGLRYWRSEANFVLVRVGHATDLVSRAAERGILIRDRSSAPGCEGCVRITAGATEAMDRCLTVLEDVLA